jgi:hypothetical protein
MPQTLWRHCPGHHFGNQFPSREGEDMQSNSKHRRQVFAVAVLAGLGISMSARALPTVGSVFIIAMENHNWTQPSTDLSAPQQIFGNANAPYINSLVTPGNPNAAQVSFASAYHNVLATPTGANPSIHPSEPNYIWSEAGTNFGVLNDNQPYGTNGTVQFTNQHLTGYMQLAGQSWKSYQEDTQVDSAGNVLPQSQWTSPIWNASGTFTTVANAYNGSKQYNYAVKHNPQAFFTDTNGAGNTNTSPANPSNLPAGNYAPLQQLQADLNSNAVGKYNWISPNQFNDQHTALTGGYKPSFSATTLTGDSAQIAQGDDFLKQIIPQIMASQAYQNNGTIIVWNDETEGANANDFSHTSMEIVISKLAKGNAYNSTLNYTHSSQLKTMQEIFNVGPFLGDAATPGTNDLSDLFATGAIPSAVTTNFVPEPTTLSLLGLGAFGLLARRRKA